MVPSPLGLLQQPFTCNLHPHSHLPSPLLADSHWVSASIGALSFSIPCMRRGVQQGFLGPLWQQRESAHFPKYSPCASRGLFQAGRSSSFVFRANYPLFKTSAISFSFIQGCKPVGIALGYRDPCQPPRSSIQQEHAWSQLGPLH
jgi:hypothetical protein